MTPSENRVWNRIEIRGIHAEGMHGWNEREGSDIIHAAGVRVVWSVLPPWGQARFVGLKPQDELTRRIQEKSAKAAKKAKVGDEEEGGGGVGWAILR